MCPYRTCDYVGKTRWLLKSHLINYHKVDAEEAQYVAEDSEYWLRSNPRPYDLDFGKEEDE